MAYVIPPLCLAVTPILTASVRLFTRELKTISEVTLSAYIVLAMMTFYLPAVCLFYGFGFLKVFSTLDWVITGLLGLTSSTLQIFMAKAAQYEEPARLAVLNYFQPII